MQELLRYTRGVEDGHLEQVEQVPERVDGLEQGSGLPRPGWTNWEGVAVALPFLMFSGLIVLIAPLYETGPLFSRLEPWVMAHLHFLDRLLVEAFGWTAKLPWVSGESWAFEVAFDPTWGPWLWALGFAFVVALGIGPTRWTANRFVVLVDEVRESWRGRI